jgi:predicted membrane channel-forming protein YqfA (hemolysin III family)
VLLNQDSKNLKYVAPKNGDYAAVFDRKYASRQPLHFTKNIWLAAKFILAVLASPIVLLALVLDWVHVVTLLALGLVSLYVGIFRWQTTDWVVSLVALIAGLLLTFGVILYAHDKIRGRV